MMLGPKVNPIERRIVQILLLSGGLMNTNEIAQNARISWNTAEAYLKRLYNKGWVRRKKQGTVIYYYANY